MISRSNTTYSASLQPNSMDSTRTSFTAGLKGCGALAAVREQGHLVAEGSALLHGTIRRGHRPQERLAQTILVVLKAPKSSQTLAESQTTR